MATALITGVNGQDGSYLAELLLARGDRVVGTVRPGAADLSRIEHLRARLETIECDLLDARALEELLGRVRPDELYNLAARSSSADLFTDPVLTGEINGLAVARLLEAILRVDRKIRFFQASSSEIFGGSTQSPQDEETPFRPRNPYGAAKLYAQGMVASFRETHGLFACSGILFNHESPRRGPHYVTRRISRGVALIKSGKAADLKLGSMDARRDWSFAGDTVRAMAAMLGAAKPGDYVVATGKTHSVREFCAAAFARADLDYRRYVVEDTNKTRPAETVSLVGNAAKARRELGWEPTVDFEGLVRMMVDADLVSAAESA
jgi:GDPmannose 4,6-dehydratase